MEPVEVPPSYEAVLAEGNDAKHPVPLRKPDGEPRSEAWEGDNEALDEFFSTVDTFCVGGLEPPRHAAKNYVLRELLSKEGMDIKRKKKGSIRTYTVRLAEAPKAAPILVWHQKTPFGKRSCKPLRVVNIDSLSCKLFDGLPHLCVETSHNYVKHTIKKSFRMYFTMAKNSSIPAAQLTVAMALVLGDKAVHVEAMKLEMDKGRYAFLEHRSRAQWVRESVRLAGFQALLAPIGMARLAQTLKDSKIPISDLAEIKEDDLKAVKGIKRVERLQILTHISDLSGGTDFFQNRDALTKSSPEVVTAKLNRGGKFDSNGTYTPPKSRFWCTPVVEIAPDAPAPVVSQSPESA